ncbi:hypothetical protein LMG28138_04984 [Pararobbsia alpina]|uniref:Uncharacterized protein n=2 Tax=Pararobbsia alpina TaxID=621374 RepID=A0A6S7DBX3_9BURK|nr:hypothetical protein LMG28138_04984 [Pararobbsia alpina]
MAGVGYAMKWGGVSLSYRFLAFYGSSDQLVQTLRLNGPALSATDKRWARLGGIG